MEKMRKEKKGTEKKKAEKKSHRALTVECPSEPDLGSETTSQRKV